MIARGVLQFLPLDLTDVCAFDVDAIRGSAFISYAHENTSFVWRIGCHAGS